MTNKTKTWPTLDAKWETARAMGARIASARRYYLRTGYRLGQVLLELGEETPPGERKKRFAAAGFVKEDANKWVGLARKYDTAEDAIQGEGR